MHSLGTIAFGPCVFVVLFLTSSANAIKQTEDPESLRPWMRELLKNPAPTNVRPGVLRFEKSYERNNRNTGEHLSLRYSVERNENAFINLDIVPGLFGVDCEDGILTLHVGNSFSMSGFDTGQLIYGGSQWGCKNANQEIGPIFKSTASIPVIHNVPNSTLGTITFDVKDDSPFSFFGR
jgi:hypothetical protein